MPRRRVVLFVHASSDLYGSDRVLLEMVRALGPSHRVIVALPDDVDPEGPLVAALRADGAVVRTVTMAVLRRAYLQPRAVPQLLLRLIAGTRALAKLARCEEVDLIISNTIAVLPGGLAATHRRVPHVWYVHETLSDEPRPLQLLLRGALAVVPGRIIANSRATARSIVVRNRGLHRRMRVIYPGLVEPLTSTSAASTPGELPSAVIVGRLSPRKGIAEALEAIALLRRKDSDVRLDVFGAPAPGQEWRFDAYRAVASELGIADLVTFHGFARDAIARISAFNILLAPSRRPEGFGLTIVEGMAAGLAVVACRNGGGSDELLIGGVTGIYCDPSPASIAAALERLVDDEALRRRLGAAASADARARFANEHFRRAFLTVLSEQSDSMIVRRSGTDRFAAQ